MKSEQIDKATLTFYRGTQYVDADFYSKGRVVSKKTSIEGFFENLKECIEGESSNTYRHTALLPSNLIALRLGKKEGSFIAFFFIPAKKQPLNLYGNRNIIPFPSLLFEFAVENDYCTRPVVYAVKEDTIDELTELYHYPFGNVYSDGRICFGSNNLKDIKEPADCLKLISLFFGCETNNDLWDIKQNVSKKGSFVLTQAGLVEYIKTQDKYPADLLESHNQILKDKL